jgi:hypothetical protein
LGLTALVSDLKAFFAIQHGCTLFQYIDELLLAGPTQKDCMEGTCLLVSFLRKAGYKVSQKKAQIHQDIVKYIKFHLDKDNADLALRGKKPSVPFWPPRPINRLRNF